MTNVAKLANQSEPEAESEQDRSPSEVRLRDGKSFLHLRAEVVPGFINVELENQTPQRLLWVSVAVIPVEGVVRLFSRLAPFSLPPHANARIPVAYTSDAACQCTILVMYRRDLFQVPGTFIHVCQTKAFLIPIPENAFQRVATWQTLVPKLTRREVAMPGEGVLSPVAVLDRLGTFFGSQFAPIADPKSDTNTASSWGCRDPPVMVTFAPLPKASMTLYGPDAGRLDQVAAEIPKWGQKQTRDADLFELGIACTTLRDALIVQTETKNVRETGRNVARLVGTLGLHVPSLAALLDLLGTRESLDQLPSTERQVYERAIAEIETQVVGRPS